MNERRILLFIIFVIVYCMYSVQMWLMKRNGQEKEIDNKDKSDVVSSELHTNNTQVIIKNEVKKMIPLFIKDACSVLQIFTEKPDIKQKDRREELSADNNTITVIGITVFLVILVLNAVLDVIKVKEEERARRKLNPDGERRQSLAEFANKKTLRRESSKFGLQLFQIAENVVDNDEEKKTRRQSRPYTRGESINSYLSDRKSQVESSPVSAADTPGAEPKLVKRQSVAKLIGARPIPMARRSSFPALPLNPDIQALMLGHRQASFDSDDEDGKGRRVRIIRRY